MSRRVTRLVVVALVMMTLLITWRFTQKREIRLRRVDAALKAIQAIDRLYAHQFGDKFSYDLALQDAESAIDSFQTVHTSTAARDLNIALQAHLAYASSCRWKMDNALAESIMSDGKWCIESEHVFHLVSRKALSSIRNGD